MTKKKALVYFVVFVVLVICAQVYKTVFLADPAAKLHPACKMVIAPSCQAYINEISAQKKYDEAVKIQKIRIKENEKILKFYKRKIVDKCLFEMTSKEAASALMACIGTHKGKRDYFLLKTADFTIRDILIDSLAVSQIQYSELKDKKAAIATLKHARKIIKQNKYFTGREEAFKLIDKEMSELK